jgi:hypothetical protein
MNMGYSRCFDEVGEEEEDKHIAVARIGFAAAVIDSQLGTA